MVDPESLRGYSFLCDPRTRKLLHLGGQENAACGATAGSQAAMSARGCPVQGTAHLAAGASTQATLHFSTKDRWAQAPVAVPPTDAFPAPIVQDKTDLEKPFIPRGWHLALPPLNIILLCSQAPKLQ